MANWLSMTWENDRMLLLAARVQNGATTFEQAAVLTLKPAPEDVGDADAERDEHRDGARFRQPSLKKQLGEFIRRHKLGKAETVVILSRADVEVRPMVFPPVPVDELPDLVKFQAAKEFNAYDPNSPLDFFITNKLENVSRSTLFPAIRTSKNKKDVPVPQSGGAPKHLLASTIRSDTFRSIQQLCDELNLTLRRVVLRPCEAAHLLYREKPTDPNRTLLFVELDANETSQTVLYQGEPVFMRSPRISCPEDVRNADFTARLVAELKRTRIAVRNEIQGVAVDDVVLCGVGGPFETLAAQVSERMEIPVRCFDPWKDVPLGGELRKRISTGQLEMPERFASLIGATIQAGKGLPSDIDFCNPKKRAEPAGYRQLVTGALAAGFFLLVCVIGFGFYSRSALTREVKVLSNRLNALQKTARSVGVERTQLKAIDDWLADDVDWFEQLGWLSRNAPGAQDMILNELVLSANHGGSMALKALVRDSSVVSPMEERLRDEKHDVKTGEKGEVKGNPLYGFRFNLSVFLSKDSAVLVPEEPEPEGSMPEDVSIGPESPESPEAVESTPESTMESNGAPERPDGTDEKNVESKEETR